MYEFSKGEFTMENIKRIRLLILDLDGTIADTIGSIRDGVNMAMEKYGFPTKTYEQTRMNIGNGARELVRLSMPASASADGELVDRVLADYDRAYGITYKNCDRCYDGMKEALITLKEIGYTLAVLSNKQDKFVKAMIGELLSEGLVSVTMGQTELPKKPDPTVPLMIARELGFEPAQTAFVGDSDVDIMTGKNAGMFTVGCAWGYRDREVLEKSGADVVLDAPAELSEIFSAF